MFQLSLNAKKLFDTEIISVFLSDKNRITIGKNHLLIIININNNNSFLYKNSPRTVVVEEMSYVICIFDDYIFFKDKIFIELSKNFNSTLKALIETCCIIKNEYNSNIIEEVILCSIKSSFIDKNCLFLKIKSYISQNIVNPKLNAEMISNNFSISKRKLHYIFSKNNHSIRQCIIDKRLMILDDLISRSCFTQKELLKKSGFISITSMNSNYKKKHGKTVQESIKKT